MLIPIVSLLMVVVLSLIVTRIAAVALMHTGLSGEAARFQARSAFSGVGFATAEAEDVVRHPVRRRIIMLLMLFGNAGIVTAISAMVVTLIEANKQNVLLLEIALLFGGLIVIWILSASKTVDRWLSRLIEWALRRFTKINISDYEALLRLTDNFSVVEKFVAPEHWAVGKSLGQLRLSAEGLLVLGISRKGGKFIGTPIGSTIITAEDTLVLYGSDQALSNFDRRPATIEGDDEHIRAVTRRLQLLQTGPPPPDAITQAIHAAETKAMLPPSPGTQEPPAPETAPPVP